ncbi:hypothetical protein [Helicobacter sp. 11S03491-1]|nr:hypothetical protein [Helicobacter sp. 11S03491-1]
MKGKRNNGKFYQNIFGFRNTQYFIVYSAIYWYHQSGIDGWCLLS